MPSDEAISCEGVVRTYRTPTGEVRALRDVTASLPRGVVTAVVGPSGSGKSSLLRLIAGMDRPSGGSIVVDGRDVGRGSARTRRLLRRDVVGYVFQRPSANLFEHLTVGEHLRVAAGAGRSGGDLMHLLDALGVAHRIDHLASELSGGEQQRVAFAQVLATGARIVVADEPTAELDIASAEYVLDRVRALANDGVTFVIATHDPRVIGAAGDRLELDHGSVRGGTVGRPTTDNAPTLDDEAVSMRWPGADLPPWLEAGDGSIVRLCGLSKSYGHGDEAAHALRDVSLSTSAGEIVGLVGRSGSGKTTLLNVTAGWERADSGDVEVPGGVDPTWSDVAVLPQGLGLMDELSVQENVEYPARLAGRLEERRDLIEDLLDGLGLLSLRRRYPSEISLGEQQRTGLARALVLGPRLLIADEPTGHQDAGWARRIFAVLGNAAAAGSCCLVATHDQALAPFIDRIVTMSDGRIVEGA